MNGRNVTMTQDPAKSVVASPGEDGNAQAARPRARRRAGSESGPAGPGLLGQPRPAVRHRCHRRR